MKKLFLSIVVASTFMSAAMAQNVNVQSFTGKIEKAKAATQDPKKGIKAATWISLGDAYVDAANANTASVYPGMPEAEILVNVGKPASDQLEIEVINGADYKHYEFPSVDIYVNGEGAVEFFLEKKAIVDGALTLAYDAYTKGLEVDSKATTKVKAGYEKLIMAARAEGANAYSLGNFALAASDFAIAAKAASSETVNSPDAGELLFYAAVTALQAEKFETSVETLLQLRANEDYHDGDIYNYLGIAYTSLGQTDKIEPILLEGLEKFQANQGILNSLISYYIGSKDDPNKVIPYIKKAQEDNPTDPNLHIAEGLAYESMEDTDKAVEAYGRALDLKPDFFDAAYNYALATYRQAGAMIKELGSIDLSNQSELDEKEGAAIEVFKKSAERMEKAHAINPTNRDAVEVLRSIYFRLSGNRLTKDDSSYLDNYNKYKSLLETM